jgi:uncharacterized lipoprotein YddW (UPF0748 family)
MASGLKHWTWITTELETPDEEWKRRLAAMRAAGIDAILPEIFNNHAAAYGSGHLPVAGKWLEQLLPLAREAGLEVHAWMHTMTCTIPEIVERHPEWYAVNGRGESAATRPAYVGYYKFLCPTRPEVHAFLRRRVEELAGYEGLTSVHLDYIRLPDVILASGLQPRYGIVQDREYPEYDYCYCQLCRSAFAEQTGVDPLALTDPSASQAWRQFRCDRITRLVNEKLAPAIRGRGKQVTAAVFPNWQHVRQQWSAWKLDAVLPMLYHSFYEADIAWIGSECRKGAGSLPPGLPLYSGLFVPALGPAELPEAVRTSIAGGAGGVSLFAARSMSEAHWECFRRVNKELGKI